MAAMTRDDFYFLFVNANSIAELGVDTSALEQILATDIESSTVEGDKVDPIIPDSLDDLDMDALDGMAFFGDDNIQEPVEACESDTDESTEVASSSAPFDLDVYMQNAYAIAPTLTDRIHRAFARADLSRLDDLMEQLGPHQGLISRQLNADEMSLLIDAYKRDHPALTELIVSIRQLDT